jgi:tetratricopeptide (TPR) repeat protein
MDQTVFADPAVADWMRKNVIPVRYDAEKAEGLRLARRYAVNSFPTFLVLDAKGNEIDRLLGAHDSERFLQYVQPMVAGTSKVPATYAKLQKEWDEPSALALIQALGQRNDLPRMGPLVRRIVQDDPDLAKPTTLEAFGLFVALEDWGGRLSPETVDLAATYLPRLGAEPRRALLGVLLARQLVREEDAAGARKVCEETLAATGPSSGFASDLEATLGAAERIAGRQKDSAAAFRRAIPLGEAEGKPPRALAACHTGLAEALAASGDAAGARSELAKAAALGARDASTLAREARTRLHLRETVAAVETARRAVDSSKGEDAEAQAALGVALAASGDRRGAVEALSHAVAIDPLNPGFRRELEAAKKSPKK